MTHEDRDPAAVAEPDGPGSRSHAAGAPDPARDAPASGPDHGRGREKGKKKHLPVWQETILLLAIALVLAVVIKALFLQAFYIPSQSMEPGLVKNDRILVEKTSYWFGGTPQRGDVVVFKDPGDWLNAEESAGPTNAAAKLLSKVGLYPSGGHLVKRVIGVGGDIIKCCDAKGRISVNGRPLNEKDYARLDGADCYGPMKGNCDWQVGPVPQGHIFVMGDNRSNSADSTVHMCVKSERDCVDGDEYVSTDLVVGKVFVLLWPSDRFKFMHRPATFADVPDAS